MSDANGAIATISAVATNAAATSHVNASRISRWKRPHSSLRRVPEAVLDERVVARQPDEQRQEVDGADDDREPARAGRPEHPQRDDRRGEAERDRGIDPGERRHPPPRQAERAEHSDARAAEDAAGVAREEHRDRPGALERLEQRSPRAPAAERRCGTKYGRISIRVKPAARRSRSIGPAERSRWRKSKTNFSLRVAGDAAEEGEPVLGIAERAQADRRVDGLCRRDRPRSVATTNAQSGMEPPGRLDHLRAQSRHRCTRAHAPRSGSAMIPSPQPRSTTVAPRSSRGPSSTIRPGAAGRVAGGVGVLALREAVGERVVLLLRSAHRARSLSGCLRTKRRIPRQCHSVLRVSSRRSVTALCSWRTTAAGMYQRSQPASIARYCRSMSSP